MYIIIFTIINYIYNACSPYTYTNINKLQNIEKQTAYAACLQTEIATNKKFNFDISSNNEKIVKAKIFLEQGEICTTLFPDDIKKLINPACVFNASNKYNCVGKDIILDIENDNDKACLIIDCDNSNEDCSFNMKIDIYDNFQIVETPNNIFKLGEYLFNLTGTGFPPNITLYQSNCLIKNGTKLVKCKVVSVKDPFNLKLRLESGLGFSDIGKINVKLELLDRNQISEANIGTLIIDQKSLYIKLSILIAIIIILLIFFYY